VSVIYPDVMAGVRAWARADADLAALVAGRVFFRIPDRPVYPLIRLYRAGGGPMPGEAPLVTARVAFDCWAADYATASRLARTVESSADQLVPGVAAAGVWFYDASPDQSRDLPDPASGRPRVVVDVLFTCRAVAAA